MRRRGEGRGCSRCDVKRESSTPLVVRRPLSDRAAGPTKADLSKVQYGGGHIERKADLVI